MNPIHNIDTIFRPVSPVPPPSFGEAVPEPVQNQAVPIGLCVFAGGTPSAGRPLPSSSTTTVPVRSRSVPTTKRSRLAGWAGYGYCASHSRFYWGLRLHLVTTVHGMPVAFALSNAK